MGETYQEERFRLKPTRNFCYFKTKGPIIFNNDLCLKCIKGTNKMYTVLIKPVKYFLINVHGNTLIQHWNLFEPKATEETLYQTFI